MDDYKKLSDAIRELQVQTGAPTSFVNRVESELLARGIPLDEEAEPSMESLREAFLRDLCRREDPNYLRDHLDELKATYRNYKTEQARLQERMDEISRALHRHMRFQSDTIAYDVVPGPEGIN